MDASCFAPPFPGMDCILLTTSFVMHGGERKASLMYHAGITERLVQYERYFCSLGHKTSWIAS